MCQYQFLPDQTWFLNPFFSATPIVVIFISFFITAPEELATQSNAQMKLNFIEVETAIKRKLCAVLEQLNQRRNRVYFSKFCR